MMIINPAFALALMGIFNSTRNESFRKHYQVKRSTEFENTYINKVSNFNHTADSKEILKPLDILFSKKIETDSCFENLNFYRSSFENKDGKLQIYRPGFLQKCDKSIYEYLLNDGNVASDFKIIIFNNISELGASYEYYQ